MSAMNILDKITNKWSNVWFKYIEPKTIISMWSDLSGNPNLTMEIIDNNLDKPWNWFEISRNSNVTMDTINKYPDKPWNTIGMKYNPNLTSDMVNNYNETYPDKKTEQPEFISWRDVDTTCDSRITMEAFDTLPLYLIQSSVVMEALLLYSFNHDKLHYINLNVKWAMLLKLYNFYDCTAINNMNAIEIVCYDIYLVKQIIKY